MRNRNVTKTHPLGFRVEPEVKEALEKAAKADGRSVSNLIERILAQWLKDNGHLTGGQDQSG
jgi:hypothetical protein